MFLKKNKYIVIKCIYYLGNWHLNVQIVQSLVQEQKIK